MYNTIRSLHERALEVIDCLADAGAHMPVLVPTLLVLVRGARTATRSHLPPQHCCPAGYRPSSFTNYPKRHLQQQQQQEYEILPEYTPATERDIRARFEYDTSGR